ncbi:MAG: TPM domain-containing protein [Bacteroidales bacterium]|nr:TPM domain-containing protein [Bacteroidales bacterium]
MKNFPLHAFLLLLSYSICGQNIPEPMIPLRLVNDFTGLLSEDQQISLNNKLLQFNDSTSTQIYVITYNDLQGYPAAEFAAALGEKWGIGQKGKDNGIVILVSPENQKIAIQTGYGLEGAVPDAICVRIIHNVISPAFKEGNFYHGLDSATSILMALTKGEFTADDYMKKTGSGGRFVPVIVLLIIFFIIFSSLRSKQRLYSPGKSIPWWVLMTMMGSSGHSQKRTYKDFHSGNGGFGGFFGGGSSGSGGFGGFSGGGGGSFGGGGASGGW